MEHLQHQEHIGNAASIKTAPVQIPEHTPVTAARPDWIRLPKPGTLCPWCGLSRSKLWEVLQSGKVRNICLRKEGAARGARLIHLASLLGYLGGLANEAEQITSASSATSNIAKKGVAK
jgi:hypothetical protein